MLTEIYKDEFPSNARIYYRFVSSDHEVTPTTPEDIEKLSKLQGEFFVVHTPEGATTAIVIAVIALVATVAAVFLLRPNIPSIALRNTNDESPNNALSGRTNTARPLERIPDIYGTVLSIPDLLTVPYSKFDSHTEYELSYMCVGRGYYEIQDITVKEDDTPASLIEGTSIEIYEPYTSPNSGIPQSVIGEAITEPLYYVIRSNNVDGLILEAANIGTITIRIRVGYGDFNIGYGYIMNTIPNINEGELRFKDFISAGDTISFEGTGFNVFDDRAIWDESTLVGIDVDFSGVYLVDSVFYAPTSGEYVEIIKLVDPGSVNANWNTYADNFTTEPNCTVTTVGLSSNSDWVYIYDDKINKLSNNFIAPSGLYKDDGITQTAIDVEIKVEYQQVDSEGTPFGSVYTDIAVVYGSASTRRQRAATLVTDMPFTGSCRVRAQRITPTDTSFSGSVVDDIKWRDLFGLYEITDEHFGDVTTVYARTKSTESATAVKERKLNMLVTRKLPAYLGSGTFSAEANPTTSTGLVSTRSAADIIVNICLDQFLGNREADEIDYDQIYETITSIQTYFGKIEASEFCYTFDSTNISFEETVAVVAQAVFCSAYRRGRKIKLFFERENDMPTILFNHRNKIPDSENRNFKFGTEKDYDGVEYTWINPADESATVFYIKDGIEGDHPISPKKIESVGVRNYYQAYWQAWREYNKIRYQHTTVEFTAVGQGELVLIGDKVLVSNNMRTDYQDGEVEGYSGMVLTTSQPVNFEQGVSYVVFLQLYDGTIQTLNAYKVEGDKHAIALGSSPLLAPVTDDDEIAKTKYILVKESESDTHSGFIVTERQQGETNTSTITCINYDPRYYANDPNPLEETVGWGYNWGEYWGGDYVVPQ
jgi:hypothetical protein